MGYKVEFYMDNEYNIIDTDHNISVFKGTLPECDAWINLTENGYL